MKSTIKDDVFRAAATKLYDDGTGPSPDGREISIVKHGNIERPHTGGAWVEALVWVSDEAAKREQEGGS